MNALSIIKLNLAYLIGQGCVYVLVCESGPLCMIFSPDVSSNFCPVRRISNTAGKVKSGAAIYWLACKHSRAVEITYCCSRVQMTDQRAKCALLKTSCKFPLRFCHVTSPHANLVL